MLIAIISIIMLVSVVLVLVVLAQNSKGGGLTSQFGGSGTSQLMGVKKTGDLLERITWGLAIALMILTLSTKFVVNTGETNEFSSPNIESAQDKNVAPAIEIPTDQPINSSDTDSVN
ncbi:preprotein translocase subunit SecG [Reichenbachiella sp. MALMAid0571]|uniref:preprotein translocase subunit SecG n=1 Tax=Reichenbachiella sp. MALMAid0571 TaxID=3143939 RepID=UPI0032DFFE4B